MKALRITAFRFDASKEPRHGVKVLDWPPVELPYSTYTELVGLTGKIVGVWEEISLRDLRPANTEAR